MKRLAKGLVEYEMRAAELWGNAKDGFENNQEPCIDSKTSIGELSSRWLTKWARDAFEGRYFNWSENSSRPMSRLGIELNWNDDEHVDIEYRGHYVGCINITKHCHCGEPMIAHYNRSCEQIATDRANRRARYVAGYNNVAHVINNFHPTEYSSSPLEHAKRLRNMACDKLDGTNGHERYNDDGFYRGVIDACQRYIVDGKNTWLEPIASAPQNPRLDYPRTIGERA